MGSVVWVPEICLTWRLRQFKAKSVLVLKLGGWGGLNAKLWQLWNTSWVLAGQRWGQAWAALMCACLHNARWCDLTSISCCARKSSLTPVSGNQRVSCTSSNTTSSTHGIAFVDAHQEWQAVSYGEVLKKQKMWLATNSIGEDKTSWCLDQVK